MKRNRDIQGKFTLKDDDYRQVRSVRLTDATRIRMGNYCRMSGFI